jgi:hypothetical protein
MHLFNDQRENISGQRYWDIGTKHIGGKTYQTKPIRAKCIGTKRFDYKMHQLLDVSAAKRIGYEMHRPPDLSATKRIGGQNVPEAINLKRILFTLKKFVMLFV